jgi:fructose/tagatose bisphosphate aldolase
MDQLRFYLAPLSYNIIDTAIRFSIDEKKPLTFIPSRRQIDVGGGYVGGGMTMRRLREYVDAFQHLPVWIERDHGGPGQGATADDGWKSLAEDCRWADCIHIDPWKAYPAYEDGLRWTVAMLNFCYERNILCNYEIGTEESIRRFEVEELDRFIGDVKAAVDPVIFSRIRFVVVQCGTALSESHNTGSFDADRLRRMLEVVEHHGLAAKEHNGDWVSAETVAKKVAIGLRHINVAPELGAIESRVVAGLFSPEDKEAFYRICLKSEKWRKWVSADFDPTAASNRDALIEICGHYVFADPEFLAIVRRYPMAGARVGEAIYARLKELYGIA